MREREVVKTFIKRQYVLNLLQIDECVAKGTASPPVARYIQEIELTTKIVADQYLKVRLRHFCGNVSDDERRALVRAGSHARR